MRIPVLGLAAGVVVLDHDASRYVRDVRRLKPGDGFVAFDPEARVEADARVVGLEPRSGVRVELAAPRPATLLPLRQVTLVYMCSHGRCRVRSSVTTLSGAGHRRSFRRASQ